MSVTRVAIRAETAGAEGLYRRLFARAGCEIVSSASGEHARDLIANVPNGVDVLVADARLVVEAPEAFSRLRAAVIFVFAEPRLVAEVEAALSTSSVEVVQTPFFPSDLDERVRAVLCRERAA
jgi:DNA-binding response OmpR family regulator